MSKINRSYNQFCALAKALDVVGERWTLLIVRELLSGPKRFKDLQDSLLGIGSNLLSTRLKDMESQQLVERAKLPPPAASAVYQLTERGLGLGNVVAELVKWGFSLLGIPKPDELFQPRWAMQALLVTFDAEAAQGVEESYEFRIDDEIFHISVSGGQAQGQLGPAAKPDLVLTATSLEFLTLGFGENQEAYAEENGLIKQGTVEMLTRFGRIFRHKR